MFGAAGCRTAIPVEMLLVPASPVRSIVLLASRIRQLATMVLAATEFAAKVPPIRIPRMREEANPTTAAVDRTACQTGMIAQDGIQRQLILTNKRISADVPVPIRPRRKEFSDGDDKNARFSVKMLSVVCISSSYSLDAQASRRRAGIFRASTPNPEQQTGTTAGRDTNSQPRLGSRQPDQVPSPYNGASPPPGREHPMWA
jgi:hypothetical protein